MKKKYWLIIPILLFQFSCKTTDNIITTKPKSLCFSTNSFNIKTTPLSLTIEGVVLDKETSKPIKDAQISFMENTYTSDQDGKYKIFTYSFEYCTYLIKVNKNGYKEQTQKISPTPNVIKTNLDFSLEKNI
jgi:hypothetical protein